MAVVDPIEYALTKDTPLSILSPGTSGMVMLGKSLLGGGRVVIVGTDGPAPPANTKGIPVDERPLLIEGKAGVTYYAISSGDGASVLVSS